jgi:hypothetical protein
MRRGAGNTGPGKAEKSGPYIQTPERTTVGIRVQRVWARVVKFSLLGFLNSSAFWDCLYKTQESRIGPLLSTVLLIFLLEDFLRAFS